MAYIQPSTDIYLLKGINIDNDYNHTLYFSSLNSQTNYFVGVANGSNGIKFAENTYQRANKNTLRLPRCYDEICRYNYLMFHNHRTGSKWYYAFVTKMEYVNEHCTLVEYELDVLQTWYFDYDLGECFIEREHTSTDELGEHVIPEPGSYSNYVLKNCTDLKEIPSISVLLIT